MTPEEQLEIYACALVLLRSSHHALDEVAQRIAEHSGELLPLLTLAGTQDDDAARSVLTAIVAAATARAAVPTRQRRERSRGLRWVWTRGGLAWRGQRASI